MYVMRKLKFKSENNHYKSNTQKHKKHGGSERDKSNENSFIKTKKHEKVILLWFRNAYVK